jgi:RES domain-containing protein
VVAVYASESRALATLEVLAGLRTSSPLPGYVLIPAEFEDALIVTIELEELPEEWRDDPPPSSTQRIGDRWVASGESAVLRVPSALLPKEWNSIFNPRRPLFSSVRIGEQEPLSFDPRLLK